METRFSPAWFSPRWKDRLRSDLRVSCTGQHQATTAVSLQPRRTYRVPTTPSPWASPDIWAWEECSRDTPWTRRWTNPDPAYTTPSEHAPLWFNPPAALTLWDVLVFTPLLELHCCSPSSPTNKMFCSDAAQTFHMGSFTYLVYHSINRRLQNTIGKDLAPEVENKEELN